MSNDKEPQGIRSQTNRSARCPWCGGPVMRDDRLIEGYLQRVVACLNEEACGWSAQLESLAVDPASWREPQL